jgi:hypothetical protein
MNDIDGIETAKEVMASALMSVAPDFAAGNLKRIVTTDQCHIDTWRVAIEDWNSERERKDSERVIARSKCNGHAIVEKPSRAQNARIEGSVSGTGQT